MKHIATALLLATSFVACDSGSGRQPTKDTSTGQAPGADTGGLAATGAPAEPPKEKAKGPFPESTHPALKDPTKANATAPAKFQAKFATTAGDFIVECTRDWAPHGVDRFYNLLKIGFFNDVALFRVMPGFVVQWGIHGNPEVSKHWSKANLKADKVKESNERGMLTYAMAGAPTTRSTQMFINFKTNAMLDKKGFAPICKVTEGMEVVDKFYAGYKGMPSREQGKIQAEGNAFLRGRYPKLDFIKTAKLYDPNAPDKGEETKPADDAKKGEAAKPADAKPANAKKPGAPKPAEAKK